MFHKIPKAIADRMAFLNELEVKRGNEYEDAEQRLLQVPEATGRFLALVAAAAPKGTWLEIGTSGGYSALWLSLAAREAGAKLLTHEIQEWKIDLARETFREAGVEDVVELITGDATAHLDDYGDISFAFLDGDKEDYRRQYDAIVPRMVPGGILTADNIDSHREVLQEMVAYALQDEHMDNMVVPIGSGVLVGRKVG
jgi:predicted O-methyltransferase YrrM